MREHPEFESPKAINERIEKERQKKDKDNS
jgi:hypothetical protein